MKLRPYIHRPRATPSTTYSPAQIAAAYNFPTKLASGGVIAIIELGGGWVQSDIDAFCQKNEIPSPTLIDVPCDSTNSPGTEADDEVALDIQIAAGVFSYCTGAAANIRLYWATDIKPAIEKIIADKQAGIPIAAVSISWGAPENEWTAPQDPATEDAAIALLAPLGIPFFAAAGDNDSGDGENDGQPHVDFPASSPHAIGCGGTSKPKGGVESVWNDGPGEGTGGGYSSVFPIQPWQVGAGAPPAPPPHPLNGRMVPDVAANADPRTGYEIYCAAQDGWQVVGGTSAVAPIYAALLAAINPPIGLTSNALATLWGNPTCFADITQGGNGAYQTSTGPDPCTGLGVPRGDMLTKLFSASSAPPAPTPEPPTPSPEPAPPVEPPHGGHHHHHPPHHPPIHGGHDHHPGRPIWWNCRGHYTHGPADQPDSAVHPYGRNFLAVDEREARRKFLKSFGALSTIHHIDVHRLPEDYAPTAADLEREKAVSGS